MISFLSEYGLMGLGIGLITFLIIGVFHPLVIKGEYYLGVRCWLLFLLAGVVFAIWSIVCNNVFVSIILGVISFSSFWAIHEVFEQKKRVDRGWFPMNPKRRSRYIGRIDNND